MPWDKKFNPNDICTVREMLTFYLRYLGYASNDLYDNALDMAIELDVVKPVDLITTADAPAIRDNFVAMAYNGLSATYKTEKEEIMSFSKESGYSLLDLIRIGIEKIKVNKK